MQIIDKSPQKLIIRIEANETLANAIRRSVLEVPTLAINEVEIFKNDSALYDEILAHRLGLISIKNDKKYSDKTKIEFKLEKKGPCIVYAEDLNGPVEIIYPKTQITLLGENHKLELIATANLGKGIEHEKYTPGLCFYRHLLEIKSSPKIDKLIENAKSVLKPQKQGSKWICDLNEAIVDEIQSIDKNAVSDSKEILLIIESFGMMSAEEILQKTILALESNLTEFENQIK